MKNKKILLIDFDENCLNSISEFLKNEGFSVITAKDGQSGLEMFNAEKPDLVIIEPMLPKVHGFDLCNEISRDKKTPIVILSEFYKEEQVKAQGFSNLGVSLFLKKPCKNEDVLEKIHELLELQMEGKKPEESLEKAGELEPLLGAEDETLAEIEENSDIDKQLKEDFLEKKEKPSPDDKSKVDKEVEELLKSTISEFGLEEKEKVEPEKKEIKPEKKEAKPEKKEAKPEKKEVEPKKEKVKLEKPKPEIEEKISAEEKAPEAAFLGEYKETKQKRAFSPVILFVVAAIIVGVVAFFIFRPKHENVSPKENLSFAMKSSEQQSGKLQEEKSSSILEEDKKLELENPTENVDSSSVEGALPEEKPKKREAPSRNIEPIVPALPSYVPTQSKPSNEVEKAQTETKEEEKISSEGKTFEKEEESSRPTAEKVKPGDLIPITEVDTPPVVIKRVNPKYPTLAARMGIKKVVIVHVLIAENGSVIKTKIAETGRDQYGFNKATEEAVRQWKFKAATKDGVNVKVWKPVSIRFAKK